MRAGLTTVYDRFMSNDSSNADQHKPYGTIATVLRATVALQCLGNWRWMTQIQETPLLHWMLDPADIGGLAWAESTALAVQQTLGWSLLLAALVVVWRPHQIVLAALFVVQLLIAIAMWRIADGYPLKASWLSPSVVLLFPFATQLLRIAAPLGLLLVEHARAKPSADVTAMHRAMQLLRWAVAIVFVAHGIEALQLNPKFTDLLIGSTQRTLGVELSETSAERMLMAVGVIDIVVAITCVCVRSLAIIGWIALWGGLTACSRIVALGWETAWHEALTRVPHCGVPMAVALWWHLLKSRPWSDTTVTKRDEVEAKHETT